MKQTPCLNMNYNTKETGFKRKRKKRLYNVQMLECWCEWKKGAKAILLTLLNEIMFDLFFTMF